MYIVSQRSLVQIYSTTRTVLKQPFKGTNGPVSKVPKKRLLFQEELKAINELLEHDIGFPLSEIRDSNIEKNGEAVISNKEVKMYVMEYFGEKIQFCQPE